MCKRCITPSYVLLFAQRWNPLETHVFVFSLYNIAFKKLSLQSKVYQIGVIFCLLSIR